MALMLLQERAPPLACRGPPGADTPAAIVRRACFPSSEVFPAAGMPTPSWRGFRFSTITRSRGYPLNHEECGAHRSCACRSEASWHCRWTACWKRALLHRPQGDGTSAPPQTCAASVYQTSPARTLRSVVNKSPGEALSTRLSLQSARAWCRRAPLASPRARCVPLLRAVDGAPAIAGELAIDDRCKTLNSGIRTRLLEASLISLVSWSQMLSSSTMTKTASASKIQRALPAAPRLRSSITCGWPF